MAIEEINQSDEIIWKDRKHFLGMPLSFTRYYIKNGRFFLSKGLFNVEENELILYRILDIKFNRTLFDKIFGVGTITLYTCDKTDNILKVLKVKNSTKVRDLISNMVEEARIKNRVTGKEIYGVGDNDSDDNMGDNNSNLF